MRRDSETIREQLSDILTSNSAWAAQGSGGFHHWRYKEASAVMLFTAKAGMLTASLPIQVLLMRRGNPFLTGRRHGCLSVRKRGHSLQQAILKFTAGADFLLMAMSCYILSSAVEKDLSLESRHFAIAQKRMALIADAGIVSDYDRLEACVMKAKNARKFLDFDKSILEHITRLPILDREEFLSTYGVTIDHNGNMDTYEAEQCELIIDLLCSRSCLDPLGRLSVVSNITTRE